MNKSIKFNLFVSFIVFLMVLNCDTNLLLKNIINDDSIDLLLITHGFAVSTIVFIILYFYNK